MPKAKKDVGYNAVFPTRLRTLLDTTQQSGEKITQQELADAVGVTRQAVGQWCIGNTVPDILCLKKIAELFGVSSDYLIGLSNAATTNIEQRTICDDTGLDENALSAILNWNSMDIKNHSGNLMLLNFVLQSDDFAMLLYLLDDYRTLLIAEKIFGQAVAKENLYSEDDKAAYILRFKGDKNLYKQLVAVSRYDSILMDIFEGGSSIGAAGITLRDSYNARINEVFANLVATVENAVHKGTFSFIPVLEGGQSNEP